MFVCLFTVICILAWLPYSHQECVYTHWGVWSSCHAPPHLSQAVLSLYIPQNCAVTIRQRVRARQLLFFQEPDHPCPHLTEAELCRSEETRACLADSWSHYATPIDPSHWRVGPWGGCRQLIGQKITCGVGLERRNVSCFDRNNSLSDSALCPAPGPADSRVCHLFCPCLLFSWAQWSPCLAHSCDQASGNRTRFRFVARQPAFGSCPSLWQREECSENISCPAPAVFKWHVGSDWSACDSTGFAHRLVLCHRMTGSNTSLSDPSSCPLARPLSRRFCPPESVYSEWGQWGDCENSCPSLRARRRQLISGDSAQLMEYSLCDDCLLSSYSCSLYNASSNQLYSQPCNLSLSSDVILSHWSDWSVCCRSLSSRFRDLMGYPAHTIPTDIPFRITQQRVCNDSTYKWRASDWSDCATDPDCVQSYQTRRVECLDSNDLSSIYCDLSDKPPSNQTCLSECGDPSPCRYSDWSEYSECSSVCGIGTRTRERIVLRSADCSHPVGAILRSAEQCMTRKCPPSYHWRVGELRDCIPLTQRGNCGPGYRTARTECLSDSGRLVPEKFCASSPLPSPEVLVSHCTLPCPSCSLSQWSPFSPCPVFCGASTRTRTRHIIGPLCPHLAYLPLSEALSCPPAPCPSYRWDPVSRWSQCVPLDNKCGRGVRHRAIACIRSDSVPFPDSFCPQTPPPVLKECYAPCPAPCVPSSWAPWSSCSSSCDGGVRSRSREVSSQALLGGQECPELFQLSPCSIGSCPVPGWVPGEWSPCVSHGSSGAACGFGTKQRSVRCLIGTNDSTSCPRPDRPAFSESCYLHCPPDCVQSEWGHWSPCLTGRQNRTRSVLRGRDGSGISCGSSQETRECPPSETHWSYSSYSLCSHSSSPCGTGTQYRNYSCEYSGGGLVASHLCLAEWGPPSALSQLCSLSCPSDCQVSSFPDWSLCSGTCSSPSGLQTRHRHVTEPPLYGGTQCPSLTQTRPCFLSSCPFPSFSRGPWSPCQTHLGTCGAGQMVRSVLCLDKFGSPLPLSSCVPPPHDPFSPFVQLDLDIRTSSDCSIPCPDSVFPDAELPKANCSSLCSDLSNGLLISPRPLSYLLPGPHTPPGDLSPEYMAHACVPAIDTCFSLEWRTSEWTGADRAVWCVASSAISSTNVSSGCDPDSRPSPSRASCLPACSNFSLCSDLSGRCECVSGFQLSGDSCLPLSGCRVHSHCPAGHVCDASQECVSTPQHTNPTDAQLRQTPAVVFYVTIGLVSLLILLCLLSAAALLACLARRLSRNRSFSFRKCEEDPPDPDPSRTPVPSCRCPSVLSEPPAYSSKDQFSSRSNSSLSLGPSLPDSFRYLSLVGSSQLSPSSPPLWSPLHVYRSPSAPMSPPPPPYQHPLEQALSNSCD